jgi:dihydrofolate synthase/folylpolyglutamate synthase
MPNKPYDNAIKWLFEQFPSYQNIGAKAYKPNLGNIRTLCSFLNHPEKTLRFVHVAGTNGKGSVASMLASVLTEAGETTGLFTSPHLIDFRERIRVNGKLISQEEVIDFCNKIRSENWHESPSFFEITFAMAIWYFKKKNCSICVIETGLGGRLDATNIIHPLLSIITNISFDHTQFLGNTLHLIAHEKAGIIKAQTPVIIGEHVPETEKVFKEIALKQGAPLIDCARLPLPTQFQIPLLGSYQKKNVQTVLAAVNELNKLGLTITETHINDGFNKLYANTGFMGRMQIVDKNPLTIIDVSHNEDGICKTLESVSAMNKGTLHVIYGASTDKDYRSILKLFPKNVVLAFCTFKNQRSLSVNDYKKINRELHTNCAVYENVNEAINQVKAVLKENDTLLIFGSFFLVSDFF